MTTANEIEQYKGDSALAGGLGAAGTQQVISGVWKMADALNTSMEAFKARNFQRQQAEYQQKIKDRDDLAKMISSKELSTDQMEDTDRLRLDSEINDLRSEFIDAARQGKISDSETYLKLNGRYKDIENRANVAKTNYIVRQAELKANSEMYDPNSTTKTVSTEGVDKQGNKQVITQQVKDENVRRSDENVAGFAKHDKEQLERMKADPNYKYQPYVPVSKHDYQKAIVPIGVDEIKTAVPGGKIKTSYVPSFQKTFDELSKNWITNRKDIEGTYREITSSGFIGNISIDSANKQLQAYNSSLGDLTDPNVAKKIIPPITANDNPLVFSAKMSFALGYGEITKKEPTVQFKDATTKKLYEEQQKANIQKRKQMAIDNNRSANKKSEDKLTHSLSSAAKSKESKDKKFEIYSKRVENNIDFTEAQKNRYLKLLDDYIYKGKELTENDMKAIESLSPTGEELKGASETQIKLFGRPSSSRKDTIKGFGIQGRSGGKVSVDEKGNVIIK